MRIIVIGIITAIFIAFGCPNWLATQDVPYIWRALSYSFFHANFIHLLINGMAIWGAYSETRKNNWKVFLASLIIAIIVYPCSIRPVVGISNVLYATIGLRTPAWKTGWWKRPATLYFFAITIGLAFLPQFSATTHIAAYILGLIGASLNRAATKLHNEVNRYNR